jgi:hypothetical protein
MKPLFATAILPLVIQLKTRKAHRPSFSYSYTVPGVTVFEKPAFQGKMKVLPGGGDLFSRTPIKLDVLDEKFKDVKKPVTPVHTGNYASFAGFGMQNMVTSIIAPPGYVFVGFEKDNFGGKFIVCSGPQLLSLAKWAKRINSAIVFHIPRELIIGLINDKFADSGKKMAAIEKINATYDKKLSLSKDQPKNKDAPKNKDEGDDDPDKNGQKAEDGEDEDSKKIWQKVLNLFFYACGLALYELEKSLPDLGAYMAEKWKEVIDPKLVQFDNWRLDHGTQVFHPLEEGGQRIETALRNKLGF